MTDLTTSVDTLESHAALACRIIRTSRIPHAYWLWLSDIKTCGTPPIAPSPAILASVESILKPLRADSHSSHREHASASPWLASISQYLFDPLQSQHFSQLRQLLATSLLPLYRCLATGRLHEGLTQTRRRLGESLTLIGLLECLNLQEFLELNVTSQVSPHQCLGLQLKLDLNRLDYLIATALPGFSRSKAGFDHSRSQTLAKYRAGDKTSSAFQTPDWASPQLLWVLSNELISSKTSLMLPRCWLDTPVPWGKITEHWHTLAGLLTSNKRCSLSATKAKSLSDAVRFDSKVEPQKLDASGASLGSQEEHDIGLEALASIESAVNVELQHELNPRFLELPDASRYDKSKPQHPSPTVAVPLVVPKVLIGEITNSKDSTFVNVTRRQIAIGRSEERCVCLSMVSVVADSGSETQSLATVGEGGLCQWQQRLVNWLSEQPTVQEPLAFLTRDQQLALIVLDNDRNEMAKILRDGLVEALTGKKTQISGDLSQVNIPAKFHVGIASASSPSASLDPEEFIASAERCLGVAQRLGKASIKSIEVF